MFRNSNVLASDTLVSIFEACHLDFCIMRTSIRSYRSVCQNNLPISIPMAITVTSILTTHSLAIWANLWSTKCVHDISNEQLEEHVGESNQLSYSLSQCTHFLKIMVFYTVPGIKKSVKQSNVQNSFVLFWSSFLQYLQFIVPIQNKQTVWKFLLL